MWFIQTQAWTALPMTITSRGLNSIDWGIVSAANGAVVLLFQPVSIKLIKYMGMQYSLAIGCLVRGYATARICNRVRSSNSSLVNRRGYGCDNCSRDDCAADFAQ